ncbi:MAG: alpha/beta hydrolase, partial [Spirochaetales bacterium]|nr:alpha/beta hydrolase [Spirochaetales bacterium]
AIAHIIENSDKYGVDSNRIALTGDSAGGHLSASAATMVERIGSNGFNTKTNKYEYNPTYLPKNMNVKQFREKLIASIKAVAPSYGVFATTALKMSPAGSEEISTNNNALNAISPITNIPESSSRKIPHFMVRGTKDPLISNQEVQSYVDALQEKGQEVVYIQIEGASHAFYDWKPDDITKKTFNQTGKTNIDEMLEFFNKYLNIQ